MEPFETVICPKNKVSRVNSLLKILLRTENYVFYVDIVLLLLFWIKQNIS